MLKTILFDFDGTIADTIPFILRCLRDLDKEQRYADVTLTDELREMSILDIARYKLKLPLLLLRIVKQEVEKRFSKEWPQIQSFPGIKEAITELRKDYRIGIVTTNREEIVRNILEKEGIVVDFIRTGSLFFGKAHILKRLLKKERLAPDEALYVGDEIRDAEACARAGISIISVTWGLNSRPGHERYAPFRIIDAPAELLEAVRAYASAHEALAKQRDNGRHDRDANHP